MKLIYYSLCFCLIFVSCRTQKKGAQVETPTGKDVEIKENIRPEPPYMTGTIRDMTGLDGCGLLIYADDGKKYQPVEIPSWAGNLRDGLRVKFAFDIMENVMSSCMAEDANIRINQIFPLDVEPKPCALIEDPYQIDWMAPIVNDEDPTRITEFVYEGERAYYLEGGHTNYLFHCRGYLICEIPAGSMNDCAKKISRLLGAKVIWVRNN